MMHTKKCHNLLGSLSEYAGGELADELCIELERHLADCENCRVVVDTLKKTIYLYHATATEPAVIPVDIRERLFKSLDLKTI
jgi:anti-sigma factor RsiW